MFVVNVLLTDPSGPVGSALVPLLVQAGHRVTAFARSDSAIPRLQALGARCITMDFSGGYSNDHAFRETLIGASGSVDAVIHLVASDQDESDIARCRRLDLEFTERLVEALPACTRVVHGSSLAVLGDHRGDWIDEDTPPRPDTPHGRTAHLAEQTLLGSGLPVTTLRLGCVYGPDGLFGRLLAMLACGDGLLPRHLKRTHMGYISAEDAARALHSALEHGRPGQTLHVADDNPQALEDVLNMVAEVFGHSPVRFRRTALRRSRVSPGLVRALGDSMCPCNARLKEALGFTLRHHSIFVGLDALLRVDAFGMKSAAQADVA